MRLIGDIGGTNARFALSEARGDYRDERKLPVANYAGLADAAAAYLRDGPKVEEAVFAVAARVGDEVVQFTNSPWSFSISATKRALGLTRLVAINDFAAQAQSVPALKPEDLRELRPGPQLANRPMLVIGPGTGLGAAFLLPDGAGWRVVPGEAGHASFAPEDDVQSELLTRLRRRLGHVSLERLLSGPGLLSIAILLAEIDGVRLELNEPRDVSARAADGSCPHCSEAVRVFSSILGAAAGNLALTLLADGGVFITGGLSRGLAPLLDVAALNRAFTGKGRFSEFLQAIRITQVLRPHTGLLGAALYDPKQTGGTR